ncbi:cytotardin-like [Mytilus californianus]|uniref:cytotardin-like n=1 Tax=Mytilus californianus TaxID=6549 RepID=UPI002247BC0C|nr:cytotardin-like [Mytilus californianus]
MEESANLIFQNERLREQIQNMSDEMANYQEEHTYMLDMLNSLLPDTMTQIDRATSKANLRFEELPRQPNDFMNKCTTAIEAVMIRYIKMKEDLIKAKQDLDDKCKSIAEWTMKVNYDSGEEMKAYQEQNKKIRMYENDIQSKVSEIHGYSSKIKELKGKYATVEHQLCDIKTSNQILEQENMKKKKELVDLQKSLEMEREESRKKDRFIEKCQAQETHLQSQIRNQENMQSLKLEKDNLKTKVLNQHDDLMKTKNDLESMKHRLLHVQTENSNLGKDIQVLKREKDDLQTRLSSVAGEKLTKGNPSITDLGDPNRPMKIGEKYGELYDNEWTDAMENVGNVKKYYSDMKDVENEEIIIRHLHRLLECCYKECFEMADGQLQKLGTTFAETMCLGPMSKEETANLPVCREASIHRRANSEAFAKYLYGKKIVCKNILNDWDYHNKHENVMQLLMETTFFEKCVYLCWSMAIQDPVMYLDDDLKAGMPLDKNTYKEFVKSGDTVVYVVWPALFLHRNGPLLYKGVAQASWKKAEQFV